MKVTKKTAVTIELDAEEAALMYTVLNWGTPIAELVAEKANNAKLEDKVDKVLDDLWGALDEAGVTGD